MTQRKCSYHCGGCDQHFTSLRAFDAHRAGAYDKRRFCRPASSVRKLRVFPGSCDLPVDGGVPLRLKDVAVWEAAVSVDGARIRLSRGANRDPGESSASEGSSGGLTEVAPSVGDFSAVKQMAEEHS